MLWNLADPLFSTPFIEQLAYFPFAIGWLAAALGAISVASSLFGGGGKKQGTAKPFAPKGTNVGGIISGVAGALSGGGGGGGGGFWGKIGSFLKSDGGAQIVSTGIGAVSSLMGADDVDRDLRKPYGGQIANRTAQAMSPILMGAINKSMMRGFADNSARLNFDFSGITRKTAPGILLGMGGVGSQKYEFGGGRTFTGLGKYEPYGSGPGTYGTSTTTPTNGDTTKKTTDTRWDLPEYGDDMEGLGAMSSSSGFGESGGTMPGRQAQMSLRGMGGGRESGGSTMNEYRQVKRMRDQVARDGKLIRGSGMPGGNE